MDAYLKIHRIRLSIQFQLFGILLFPLSILAYYTPFLRESILITGIIAIGIWLIVRIISMLHSGHQSNIGIIYIILYLCTLEILPLWLMGYSLLKEFNGIVIC